jgi:hypothetical protein
VTLSTAAFRASIVSVQGRLIRIARAGRRLAAGGAVCLAPVCALASSLPEATSGPQYPTHPPAGQLIEDGPRLSRLVGYDGWTAWNVYDASSHRYKLRVREPSGTIRSLNAAKSKEPLEIGLGPLPNGEVGAVIARCANETRHRSCALDLLNVQAQSTSEQRLAVPVSGSLTTPDLWMNTIAFVRTPTESKRSRRLQLYEWTIGSAHAATLPLAAHKTKPDAEFCPRSEKRCTEAFYGEVVSLSLQGEQVAYVTRTPWVWPDVTADELWIQAPGGRARFIDGIGTGEDIGERTFLSPELIGEWLYAYRSFFTFGQLWARYNVRTNAFQKALVGFDDTGTGNVPQVVPLGDAVIWNLRTREEEPGETEAEVEQRFRSEPGPDATGNEIYLQPSVTWVAGCSSRSMLEHGGACKQNWPKRRHR